MTAKSMRADLLVEIGCEELPAAGLIKLAESFAYDLASDLFQVDVIDDTRNPLCFVTPRRLAVLLKNVLGETPSSIVARHGPSKKVAFDADGKPTAAALGFARSYGVDVKSLKTENTDKGERLVHYEKIGGEKLGDILTGIFPTVIHLLPIAKRMRWGAHEVEFVRPVHWLLALHGDDVVDTKVLGLKADRFTYGHRFHAKQKLKIARAGEYEEMLKSKGKVIASFSQRRTVIKKQLAQLAAEDDVRVEADASLLELVTGLVEWPQALMGKFDHRFLKLPDEVLVSCMVAHQKYFHLRDSRGELLPAFIAVSNIESLSPKRVQRGNERVLRARLADAEFFWNNDLKTPLATRVNDLKGVLFHHQLGSLHDKTIRIAQLARIIAESLGANPDQAARAALLCKADLVTDMVGEFPELQGTMGRLSAEQAGEEQAVADAIEQHYWPRRRFDTQAKKGGNKLPRTVTAQCLAVADRIDSLLGIFAAGEAPTGDKDPFALRRAALGVLRILIEKQLELDLWQLLEASRESYVSAKQVTVTPDSKTVERVFEFISERLKAYYQPMGYSAAQLASVMACRPTRPLDFDRRLKALSRFFADQPEAAESLAAANKRIAGILTKAGGDGVPKRYDETLFQHAAETELARQLEDIGARACFAAHDDEQSYDRVLKALSELKQPVDAFFDEVMVMEKDAAIRNNRLALLSRIRELFLGAADISFMSGDR